MRVAYNALGKSVAGKPILGHVFFDSKVEAAVSHLGYKILAYQFLCDNMFHFASGPTAGYMTIPVGPTPDVVISGNAVWKMGAWLSNTGVWFQAVDNTVFEYPDALRSHYLRLPPRMELCCDFLSAGPFGPFHPQGWLKLIWDPQFAVTEGLKPDFFADMHN